MSGLIQGVVTDDARLLWPQMLGGLGGLSPDFYPLVNQSLSLFGSFKIGNGGWVTTPSGAQVPRIPDPSLRRLTAPLIQEIDAIVDMTRAGPQQRYPAATQDFFEKALTAADVVFQSPTSIRVRCFLDLGEPAATFRNPAALGNFPNLWEIGIYAALQQGTAATIQAGAPGGQMQVTGLSGMNVVAGETLTLVSLQAKQGNNGTFPIVTVVNPTTVNVTNGSAQIPDGGPFAWARSSQKLMIAYGTMAQENKTSTRQLNNYVVVTF